MSEYSKKRTDIQGSVEVGTAAVSSDQVAAFSDSFHSDRANRVARNAVVNAKTTKVGLNRDAVVDNVMTFSHEIESGPITHQKRSGRCWAFAALNRLRLDCMEKMDLEDFELSESYVMFWDKFERANFFLENVLRTVEESKDSRLFMWLMDDPLNDGGQWDMFVNLVEKYGVVPKEVYPESKSSSATSAMNGHLTAKLREWAGHLRQKRTEGASLRDLRRRKEKMLETVYRILVIHNGEPPSSFDWSWRDSDDEFHDGGTLNPKQFYDRYVDFHFSDYVSLLNCPTDDKPFGHTYTVDYLGNVAEGRPVTYLNVELDVLKAAVRECLERKEAVWFGCDVGKHLHRDEGIIDVDAFEFESLYDTQFGMDKAKRVDYGHSTMTHAMLLTGMHVRDGEPVRWKVENSWGEDAGKDGFLVMSDDWFDEYVFQAVVPKSFVPDTLLEALQTDPVVLPPWDPMGSLAQVMGSDSKT